MTENILITVLLILILSAAAVYILRGKKNGRRCIGCPDSSGCCGSCSSCKGGQAKSKK